MHLVLSVGAKELDRIGIPPERLHDWVYLRALRRLLLFKHRPVLIVLGQPPVVYLEIVSRMHRID